MTPKGELGQRAWGLSQIPFSPEETKKCGNSHGLRWWSDSHGAQKFFGRSLGKGVSIQWL